jgi:hypothetical protein
MADVSSVAALAVQNEKHKKITDASRWFMASSKQAYIIQPLFGTPGGLANRIERLRLIRPPGKASFLFCLAPNLGFGFGATLDDYLAYLARRDVTDFTAFRDFSKALEMRLLGKINGITRHRYLPPSFDAGKRFIGILQRVKNLLLSGARQACCFLPVYDDIFRAVFVREKLLQDDLTVALIIKFVT